MPGRTRAKIPAYTLHRASGQAVVRIAGKDYYLGRYGSAESREAYQRRIAELVQHDRQAITAKLPSELSVNELILAYWHYVQGYYVKDGQPTSEQDCIRSALRPLRQLYGLSVAVEFGPRCLKTVRDEMIRQGRCRQVINRDINRVRALFRWAVEEELIPVAVYQALKTVAGLKKNRTSARESTPVTPVPMEHVEATLPHLPAQLVAMIQFQLLTGARPGEICRLRPCDITIGADGVWCYRPHAHKTEHHDKERRIYVGPRAQEILRPWLDRPADAYCFSPREVRAAQQAAKRRHRKTPMTPSQVARKPKRAAKRPPGNRYTKDSYRRAIKRACDQAFPPPAHLTRKRVAGAKARKPSAKATRWETLREWKARLGETGRAELKMWWTAHRWHPNQLRHTRATELRARYGLEAAQTVLGHGDPKTTTIYAERDFARAAAIMREVG